MSRGVLVVDAGNILWRCVHAAHGKRGIDPGESFLRSCEMSLRNEDLVGLHVCWDGSRRGRREIVPTYKEGKGADRADEDLRAEFDAAREGLRRVLPLLGAGSWISPDWEADDACATLSARIAEEGGRAFVLSGDKDLLQCVRKGVRVLRVGFDGRPKLVGVSNWELETKLAPVPDESRSMAALLSLRGDAADGVPGVRGVGDVLAREALATYPDLLDRVFFERDLSALRPRARTLLSTEAARQALLTSYELVRLRFDVPLVPFVLDAGGLRLEDVLVDLGWTGVEDLKELRRARVDSPGKEGRTR